LTPIQIGPSSWVLKFAIPGKGPAFTNSLISIGESGGVFISDPGVNNNDAIRFLSLFLESQNTSIKNIHSVFLTHSHHDHVGLASPLKEISNCSIFMSQADHISLEIMNNSVEMHVEESFEFHGPAELIPEVEFVSEGFVFEDSGTKWKVIETPGHTPGHLSLVNEAEKQILTGDAVLPTIFSGVGLSLYDSDKAVDDYLQTLALLSTADAYSVIPGHGNLFNDMQQRRNEITAHILRRALDVAFVNAQIQSADPKEIAPHLTWTSSWEQLLEQGWSASAFWQTKHYISFINQTEVAKIQNMLDSIP
jgi:glyoxylase-like metal-dependent hydrolase (beta-lactamase superfamily II)